MKRRYHKLNNDVGEDRFPDFPKYVDFMSITPTRMTEEEIKKLATKVFYYSGASLFRFGRAEMAIRNLRIWLTCSIFGKTR